MGPANYEHTDFPAFPSLRPLSPAQNERHHRRGCEAPPPPAPRPAASTAGRSAGLGAPLVSIRSAETTSPCRPGARVAGPRRGPPRHRGRGGQRRDRLLAGELLHVSGTLRSLRSGAVVPHQALRQVQGPGPIPAPPLPSSVPSSLLSVACFHLCSLLHARSLLLRSQRAHVHARVLCGQGAHRTRAWVRCVRATLARQRTAYSNSE